MDGVERASLTPGRKSEAPFEVEEGAKLIEVRTASEEGDLALAVHALSYDDAAPTADPSRFSTELAGGRKISFTISPLRQMYEQDGAPVLGFSVMVSYEEPRLLPALRRAWRRLGSFLPWVWRPRRRAEARVWRYSLAAILIAVGAPIAASLLIVRERTSQQAQGARHKEPVTVASPLPSSPPLSTTMPPYIEEPRMSPSPPTTSGPTPKTSPGVLPGEAGAASASLLEVKKICVEVTGDRRVDPAITDHLNLGLQASQRWTVVRCDKADALLSVVVGSDGREISVRLVNQEGEILWPGAGGDRRRKYGVAVEEAEKIVADLLADVRELECRR